MSAGTPRSEEEDDVRRRPPRVSTLVLGVERVKDHTRNRLSHEGPSLRAHHLSPDPSLDTFVSGQARPVAS
jgi:hypothetical protein